MRNQSGQGLYRGGENKAVKLTKAEKVYNALAKDRRRAEPAKKEAVVGRKASDNG